jgi:hypothetical protein
VSSVGNFGQELNLQIRQGATFGPVVVTLTDATEQPLDLTGCQFRGQIRKTRSSPVVVAEFSFTISDPLVGKVSFGLADDVSLTIPCGDTTRDPLSQYVYDILLDDTAGATVPVMYGAVSVLKGVTRAP